MSVNGVLQLKKLKVVYSAWGGSSGEAKNLLGSKQWADFRAANSAVEIGSETKGNVHPYLHAEYTHGRTKTICLRKESALNILKRAEALRDSKGYKAKTWVEKHRHITKRPSIQGQWNPFFEFAGEPSSIKPFEPVGDKYPRPKYQQVRSTTKSWEPQYKPIENFRWESRLRGLKRRGQHREPAGVSPASPSL